MFNRRKSAGKSNSSMKVSYTSRNDKPAATAATSDSTTSNPHRTLQPGEKGANVIIVGGGPVGLASALLLREYGRRTNVYYNIHVYERRWKANPDGSVAWKDKSDGNNRRGQVTTIQSNVWSLLPGHVKAAMFNALEEDSFIEMWPLGPDSNGVIGFPRNIPIRRTEDVLLRLLQEDSGDRASLTLEHNGSPLISEIEQPTTILHPETFDLDQVDYPYDFIIMADGGGSRTERTFFPDSFGTRSNFPGIDPNFKDSVLGIFLDGSRSGEDAFDVSLSESMALTVSQNRFLLNPLGKRRGFLNMWLTEEEAKEVSGDDGSACIQRAPCVFARQEGSTDFRCPARGSLFSPAAMGQDSPLWRRIIDGLKLYGIPESSVKSFTQFQLGPYYRRSNFLAPIKNKEGLNSFAFVVGDAAMQVNFRAGRGLNTGFKGAVMLTRTITNLISSGRRRTQWHASLVEFEGFMSKLQEREVFIRSLLMMKGAGDSPDDETTTARRMQMAFDTYKNTSPNKRARLEREARETFFSTVSSVAKRSFASSRLPGDLPSPNIENLKKQIERASGETLYMMATCGAWNVGAAGGKEIGFNDVVEPVWEIPDSVDQSAAKAFILQKMRDPDLERRMGFTSATPATNESVKAPKAVSQAPKAPAAPQAAPAPPEAAVEAPVPVAISEPEGMTELPFPDRSGFELDNHKLTKLEYNGFTKGLARALVENSEAFPVRYFIIDNSGSMNKDDGHKLIETMNGKAHKIVSCTRWEAMTESVNYHASLSGLLHAPTYFQFLNRPGGKSIPHKFSVAAKSGDGVTIEDEVREARNAVMKTSPGGFTPLCAQIKDLIEVISPMADLLMENGQKAVVTIATDGIPTDMRGKTTDAIQEEFADTLRDLHQLPVWLVISLYTDEADVIKFYDELDKELELSIDVIGGYFDEAKTVLHKNPWVNYGQALHQMRETGLSRRIFDMLDERLLTRSELREFCCLTYGLEYDSMPDPNSDWDGFKSEIENLNRTTKRTYDPVKGKLMPWVDMEALEKLYGEASDDAELENVSQSFLSSLSFPKFG